MARRTLRWIGAIFVRGLLVFLPAALTIWTVYLVAAWIDGIVTLDLDPSPDATLRLPGLGIVIALVTIFLCGWLATQVIGERFFGSIEHVIGRLPLIRVVHASLKDLMGAVIGNRRSFDRPVLVTLTQDGGAKALGYVTMDGLETPGLEDHVAVYFPQAYNFAGQLVFFPRAQVQPVHANPSDFMALIVSGGVSGSAALKNAAPPPVAGETAAPAERRGAEEPHEALRPAAT